MSGIVAVLEQIARTTLASLERLEGRLNTIEANQRTNLSTIEANQRTQFLWLLGALGAGYLSIVAILLGMLGVIARGFHWI